MLAAEKRMGHEYVESIYELNGSTTGSTLFQATAFRLMSEFVPENDMETALWGGAVFEIYHTEIEANLVAYKKSSTVTDVYFEQPALNAHNKRKIMSKALWRLEAVHQEPWGGKLKSNQPIRLKHYVSHEYLVLFDDGALSLFRFDYSCLVCMCRNCHHYP